MRLSRIYVAQPLTPGASIQLDPAASHYVQHVLRLEAGATIALFNGVDNCDYEAFVSYQGKQAIAAIQTRIENDCDSTLQSEIILGLSRNDHMDWMVQKTTELGVSRISIFNAEHTQIPLKPQQLDKRLAHWRSVAINACEQCGRHKPPEIRFDKKLEGSLGASTEREIKWLLDSDGVVLNSLATDKLDARQISILVGPEGGLSTAEIKVSEKAEFKAVRLGPRVLRTETAAVSALTIAQSLWGDI